MVSEAKLTPTGTTGQKRKRLGVFIEWINDGYSDPILDEIVLLAKETNVDVVCFVNGLNPGDFPVPVAHYTHECATPRNMDAVLVVSAGNGLTADQIATYFQRLEPLPIASVAVHWNQYPKIVVDNESGVRAGVKHLIQAHGKRRIACLRGPEVSAEANARFRAYREALEEHGIEFDPALVTTGYFMKPNGVEAVRLWLDERKLSIDAIVAANDGMAQGALEELLRRGLRVPDDIALLGFDDIDAARFWRPPLSTVRQPIREHARKAFEVVMALAAGQQALMVTSVRSQLVLRRSCGCIASSDRALSSFPPEYLDTPNQSALVWAQRSVRALFAFSDVVTAHESADDFPEEKMASALSGDRTPFLRWLENLLDGCIRRHIDVLGVFNVLRDIRHASRHLLRPVDLNRAEALLSDADSVVAEVAERSQAAHRYRHDELFKELVQTNEELIAAADLPSLQRILTNNLQRFGIRSCYLCLYEGDRIPAEFARLVLACNIEMDIDIPPDGLRFPTEEILPLNLMDRPQQVNWLLCGLARKNSDGYFVIERGTPEGFVYEGLLDQLGSAYRRINLMHQVITEARLRERAERERLEREMQIATNIQTGMLPRNTQVDGLEISAVMHPATEVGGDYYDVIPTDVGCWIGIGDVAGHGLPTGLVMMMLQSVVGGLVRNCSTASPKELLPAINSLLYDNIRRRLNQDEHITLTLIRYEKEGILTFAGAHEDILICRAEDARIECVRTPGVWTAAVHDVRHLTEESSLRLDEGDILLLYTDGITEAKSPEREMFGMTRLAGSLARHHAKPVEALRDAILSDVRAWMHTQDDDMTLFVAKQSRQAVRISTSP